jgi:hypothetical protein
VLQLGTAPGRYDLPNVTDVSSVTYAAGDMCQAPATTSSPDYYTWPGVMHHARVTGLRPGTRYYSRPVTAAGVPGAETSWVTGASVGPDVPTRFVAYGDMYISSAPGAVDTSLRVTARLDAGEKLDFLLHFGAWDAAFGGEQAPGGTVRIHAL